MKTTEHYNLAYFDWQRNQGKFGAWADLDKFRDYVLKSNRVIDFGCGGGYLLAALKAKEKVGIEINPVARKEAIKNGVKTYTKISSVTNNWADVIISNHALEHVEEPLVILKELRKKLKPGGRFVCVVPCETVRRLYDPDDVNQHLYSWSPLNLGNLFKAAGYKVIESKPYIHKWPPNYMSIAKWLGRRGFNLYARLYGRLHMDWAQVRLVAERPKKNG